MRTLPVQSMVAMAACLIAADPVWKSKPASQWTEEDTRQVLAESPWAKETRAVITRRLQPSVTSPVHYIATTLGERSCGSARGIEIARDRTSHVARRRL